MLTVFDMPLLYWLETVASDKLELTEGCFECKRSGVRVPLEALFKISTEFVREREKAGEWVV